MSYHYGQTIKEYRIACNMTLARLASLWPSKEIGVNIRYVQDIEAGRKHISDVETLRKLAVILNIPLWKFGLSEYNPFVAQNISVFMDIQKLHELIQDTWYLHISAPLNIFQKKIQILSDIFLKMIDDNIQLLNNKDFMRLYAQVKRLQAASSTENKDYVASLNYSYDMLKVAHQSCDTVSIAIAYTRIGVELLRNNNKDALDYLEEARDISFSTSSKEVAALCYAFLARGYATFQDEKKFIRSIDTAINLANDMKNIQVVTKDYVFHAYSAILEEKSNGFILLSKGKEAFHELPEIDMHVEQENNIFLRMWMPLDYAQSFMLMNEIEESVKWLETFYERIRRYKSARINGTVERHLKHLDGLGYAHLKKVQNFKDIYNTHCSVQE